MYSYPIPPGVLFVSRGAVLRGRTDRGARGDDAGDLHRGLDLSVQRVRGHASLP